MEAKHRKKHRPTGQTSTVYIKCARLFEKYCAAALKETQLQRWSGWLGRRPVNSRWIGGTKPPKKMYLMSRGGLIPLFMLRDGPVDCTLLAGIKPGPHRIDGVRAVRTAVIEGMA